MHGLKYCIVKLVFLNGKRPTAEGKGHGTLFEVGFRRKNPEHAMHPQGGGGS